MSTRGVEQSLSDSASSTKSSREKSSFPVSYGRDNTKDWNAGQNQQMGQHFNNQSSRPLSSAGTFSKRTKLRRLTALFSSSSSRTTTTTTVRNSRQSPLPKDWQEFVDQSSGKSYFYNCRTKVTTWTRPSEREEIVSEPQSTAASLFGNSVTSHGQPEMPVMNSTAPRTISSPKRSRKKATAAPSIGSLFGSGSSTTSKPEMPVMNTAAPMTISSPKRSRKKTTAAPSLNSLFGNGSDTSTTSKPEMPVMNTAAPMTISSPKRSRKKTTAAPSLNSLFGGGTSTTSKPEMPVMKLQHR